MEEQKTQNTAGEQKPAAAPRRRSAHRADGSNTEGGSIRSSRGSSRRPRRGPGGKPGGNRRGKGRRQQKERVKPEFDQKIVSLRRVTRVMAGGRRFSFSVAMVIGDKKGRVGVGVGKANDTSQAIQKAYNDAKNNMIFVQTTDERSLPFASEAKFKATSVTIRPNGGRGLVAGSSVRNVLELAGLNHVTARVMTRSRNKLNNARAAMAALQPYAAKPKQTVGSNTEETSAKAEAKIQ